MATFSASDLSRQSEPVLVKVRLTNEGSDKHAENRQVPEISLDIADMESTTVTTNATLTLGNARKLGLALIALADEANSRNDRIEPNQ
jgi:hypothetical protein